VVTGQGSGVDGSAEASPSGKKSVILVEGVRTMSTATVEEVQAHLPEMLKQLGAGDEVVIIDQGKAVGRLVPELPKGKFILGRGKGKLIKFVDDDEHLKDFEDYMS
jgi:antitoxin (DNA-binding transcriptional repressor) of toxin-antitoxin stability system